jgi:hypothetical protein
MNWYLVSERREERLRQGKEGQLSESDQLYSQPRQSKSADLGGTGCNEAAMRGIEPIQGESGGGNK